MTTPPRTPTTAAAPSLMPTLIHECGHGTVVRLPDDWQQRVESGWYAIPIVACGNPWHYANLDRPAIEAAAAERERILDVEIERLRAALEAVVQSWKATIKVIDMPAPIYRTSVLDAMAVWPKGANGPLVISAYESLVERLREHRAVVSAARVGGALVHEPEPK